MRNSDDRCKYTGQIVGHEECLDLTLLLLYLAHVLDVVFDTPGSFFVFRVDRFRSFRY